ncbi:MAG: hypothetical protein RL752_518, partial [Actinomycetota bacterium]
MDSVATCCLSSAVDLARKPNNVITDAAIAEAKAAIRA